MRYNLVLLLIACSFGLTQVDAQANTANTKAQIQCANYLSNGFHVHHDNTYYRYNDRNSTETFRLGANSCLPSSDMKTYKGLHQKLYHYQRYIGKKNLANQARTEIVQFMMLTSKQETDCRHVDGGGVKCTWKDGRGRSHNKSFASLNADLVNMHMDKAVMTKWEITKAERAEQNKARAEEAEEMRVETMEKELEQLRKQNMELSGQINRMHAQVSANPQCRINAGTGSGSGSGGSSNSSISAYARTTSLKTTSGSQNPTAFVNTDMNDDTYLQETKVDSTTNFNRTPASAERKNNN